MCKKRYAGWILCSEQSNQEFTQQKFRVIIKCKAGVVNLPPRPVTIPTITTKIHEMNKIIALLFTSAIGMRVHDVRTSSSGSFHFEFRWVVAGGVTGGDVVVAASTIKVPYISVGRRERLTLRCKSWTATCIMSDTTTTGLVLVFVVVGGGGGSSEKADDEFDDSIILMGMSREPTISVFRRCTDIIATKQTKVGRSNWVERAKCMRFHHYYFLHSLSLSLSLCSVVVINQTNLCDIYS